MGVTGEYIVVAVLRDADGNIRCYVIKWVSGPKAGEEEYVRELP